MKIKLGWITILILVAIAYGAYRDHLPKPGQVYVWSSPGSSDPFDPESRIPWVRIATIIEVKEGYARCEVAGVRANGKTWHGEDSLLCMTLGERIKR